jgi:hypothetical protein
MHNYILHLKVRYKKGGKIRMEIMVAARVVDLMIGMSTKMKINRL